MLRCNCGDAIEITGATYSDDYLHEQYECPECGRTGGYRVNGAMDNGHNSDTYGCVATMPEV